jgi:Zn-dependent protease with chaperone function/tetratricopeptide (TPR) repeat protein
MSRLRLTMVFGWLALSIGIAGAQQRYDDFNVRVHRELQAIDPAADALFRQADEGRQRGDHRAAIELYKRVLERVPTFVHAMRRQAAEELTLGNRRTALSLLGRAVDLDASAENLSMLAFALIQRNGEASPTDADLARAGELARQAVAKAPNDPDTLAMCGQVALVRGDRDALDRIVAALSRIEPDAMVTHYLSTFAAWSRDDFSGALAALERARKAGLPDTEYQSVRAAISAARPIGPEVTRLGGIVAAGWLGGALALFGTGLVLSTLAIRMSTRVPGRVDGRPRRGDVLTRLSYRLVLFASCAYYYLSMPLLLGVVLLVGGGLVYAMLSIGRFPIKLLIIVVVIAAVTIWAILKSLFVRSSQADPGVRIFPDEHRRLWQLLRDVAERVGTRQVDSVYLTPGTELAVFERGGLWRQMSAPSERCLILGVGTLDNLRLRPFKAVLAHEYGHFSNRDTAGGGFALAVRRSVFSLAMNLARGGAAAWYNPVWLFVQGFHHLFLRISQGASRLQEVLADRWAATLYGAQAFEDGLRHVIDRSVRFSTHVNAAVNDAFVRKQRLKNLYQYEPAASADAADLDEQVRQVLEAEPSPYDSHPRPIDRFRWAHALDAPVVPAPDDAEPVWGLFDDRAALEARMTVVVQTAIDAARENASTAETIEMS